MKAKQEQFLLRFYSNSFLSYRFFTQTIPCLLLPPPGDRAVRDERGQVLFFSLSSVLLFLAFFFIFFVLEINLKGAL